MASAHLADGVAVSGGLRCLDLAKAPFARINGQLIQNATLESVCAAITEIMNRQEEA